MSIEWYEELREANRPKRIKVLLIAESPPDPGAAQRRFFYSPILLIDNLYRGVAEAVYGENPDFAVEGKEQVLQSLRRDGFWLLDAVRTPINKMKIPARRRAIRENRDALITKCRELEPERGVIICHGMVYDEVAMQLREAGIYVMHNRPLPFPLGNWRKTFIDGFRNALRSSRA